MFLGIVIFFVAAILLVGAFVVLSGRRREYEDSGAPGDRGMTDEEFRRIEFGDEDV
jgi:hypothetical protein